jgi:TatD DNase family protein
MLIETDAPYLAPVPYRGKRNEPAYVVQVAEAVAQIRNDSVEHIADITTRNARELFALPERGQA